MGLKVRMNKWGQSFAILVVICFLFISGCSEVQSEDYFPHKSGTEWTYKIELQNGTQRLSYGETYWFGGGKVILQKLKGISPPAQCGGTCHLKMKIVGITDEKESKRMAGSLKLEIVQDDLNIFHENYGFSGLYWSKIDPNDIIYVQTIAFNSSSPTNPFLSASVSSVYYIYGFSAKGYMERIIFFTNKQGIAESLEEGRDGLIFIGFDNKVPPCYSASCMHFRREVRPDGHGANILFTEDTWFAKNKGLVFLEQQTNNQTSMIWSLESYNSTEQ